MQLEEKVEYQLVDKVKSIFLKKIAYQRNFNSKHRFIKRST